jgi:PKD repeat protein
MSMKTATICNLLYLALSLTSCDTGARYYLPVEPIERLLASDIWVVKDGVADENSWSLATGNTPLEVAFTVGASTSDRDSGLREDQKIPSMEVDFGDGSGWQDITALYYVMDFDYDDGVDLSRVAGHTYTEPGEYIIRARATYWDGEVISLDETTPQDWRPQPIRVTVTEAQAPAP